MQCCYATSVHQTFTKKIICLVPVNNKIVSIRPLPPLMEGIGGVVIIFPVRGVEVGWTFSGVTKTLILPRSEFHHIYILVRLYLNS